MKRYALLLAVCLSVSSCGFKLNQQHPRPLPLTLGLQSKHPVFNDILTEQARLKNIKLAVDDSQQALQLHLYGLNFKSQVLAYGLNMQTSAARLTLKLSLQVERNAKPLIALQAVTVSREYVANAQSIVLWEGELEILRKLLMEDAARQIIERIDQIPS